MPPVIPRAVLHIIARQEERRHADRGTQHGESDQRVHDGQNARFIRSKCLQARIAVSSPCTMQKSPPPIRKHTHNDHNTLRPCNALAFGEATTLLFLPALLADAPDPGCNGRTATRGRRPLPRDPAAPPIPTARTLGAPSNLTCGSRCSAWATTLSSGWPCPRVCAALASQRGVWLRGIGLTVPPLATAREVCAWGPLADCHHGPHSRWVRRCDWPCSSQPMGAEGGVRVALPKLTCSANCSGLRWTRQMPVWYARRQGTLDESNTASHSCITSRKVAYCQRPGWLGRLI